jgi:hypothetical protein
MIVTQYMVLISPKIFISGCAAFSDEENYPKNHLVQKELHPFTARSPSRRGYVVTWITIYNTKVYCILMATATDPPPPQPPRAWKNI